jgi:hypothetical protein
VDRGAGQHGATVIREQRRGTACRAPTETVIRCRGEACDFGGCFALTETGGSGTSHAAAIPTIRTGDDDLKDRVLGLGVPGAGDEIRTRDPLLGKHGRLLHAWIGAKTLVSTA